MGAKSAMKARFSNRIDARIVSVPLTMRPTAESIARMGKDISEHIETNNVMRSRSMHNAAKRSVQ